MFYSKKVKLSNLQISEQIILTFPDIRKFRLLENKPLLICDADEVIYDFMDGFEKFLINNSFKFLWKSYALTGNIVDKKNIPITDKKVKMMIEKFFKECTLNLRLVRSAKKSLNKIAEHYQIIILSNIPFRFYEQRLKSLQRNELAFPFFANQGGKGKACSCLFKKTKKPVWFIDDSPMQINSVKQENNKINTILYIENNKLAKLVQQNKICDFYSTSWLNNEKILLS